MFRARIQWVPSEQGGRRELPSAGCRYAPTLMLLESAKLRKFPRSSYIKEGLVWSVYFEIPSNTDDKNQNYVDIYMVAEELNLPNIKGRMTSGTKFQLMEGAKTVAYGEVL